jgi:hypothetical protein
LPGRDLNPPLPPPPLLAQALERLESAAEGGALGGGAADSGREQLKRLLFSNRSAAHLRHSLLDKALADASACVALDASWAKGHHRLAVALKADGQLEKARARATLNETQRHALPSNAMARNATQSLAR